MENGVEKNCNPCIRFKCLMFTQNAQHSIYLHAEPQRNADGVFVRKIVTFKIYEVSNGIETRVDAFTREQVQMFYVSRSDNRSAKMQI